MQKLNGSIKEYAWGGNSYISELFGIKNPNQKPFAEIWFGTHPGGQAHAHSGQTLASLLSKPLPFLVKVLDVKDMLSIQTHPNLDQAKQGFEYEEQKGLPLDSPIRTYKDNNHKPELMVALSEFYLLQGFKTNEALHQAIASIPSFHPLIPVFMQAGLQGLYAHVMTMDQQSINKILKPLGQKIKPLYTEGRLTIEDPNYWAARAFLNFNRKGICDRGIISIYLMNLLKLNEGEGIFQAPGVLHAYLEGQNLECMACSDNVLRGGLTRKHINIKGLLNTVVFLPGHSEIILPHQIEEGWFLYPTPTSEFVLYKLTKESENTRIKLTKSKLVIILRGTARVDNGKESTHLTSANVYYSPPQVQLRFHDISPDIKLYLATTP